MVRWTPARYANRAWNGNKYVETHRHKAVDTKERPFFGPVAQPENQAAHGNICVVETCSCGATRKTNVNGRHTEAGRWEVSHD